MSRENEGEGRYNERASSFPAKEDEGGTSFDVVSNKGGEGGLNLVLANIRAWATNYEVSEGQASIMHCPVQCPS
jgi:hypothetical protein